MSITLLLLFNIFVLGDTNVSILYGWNGSETVPLRTESDGTLKVDITFINLTTGNLTVNQYICLGSECINNWWNGIINSTIIFVHNTSWITKNEDNPTNATLEITESQISDLLHIPKWSIDNVTLINNSNQLVVNETWFNDSFENRFTKENHSLDIGVHISAPSANEPPNSTYLVNKEYVDRAFAGLEFDFFLTDTPSDISGYFVMQENETKEAESLLISAALSGGLNQSLDMNFSTRNGSPEFTILASGVYDVHMHMAKSGGASKSIHPYWKLFISNSSGEFLMLTSEVDAQEVTNSFETFDIHGVLNEERAITSSDRLVLKFYADVIGGGGTATITLEMEGESDSHLATRTTSEFLVETFVRRDGTKSLIADWKIGPYSIIAQSLNASDWKNVTISPTQLTENPNSTSWNRSGTNVLLANQEDNVGIGIVPSFPLQVLGQNNNFSLVLDNDDLSVSQFAGMKFGQLNGFKQATMIYIRDPIHPSGDINWWLNDFAQREQEVSSSSNVQMSLTRQGALKVENANGPATVLAEAVGFKVTMQVLGGGPVFKMGTSANDSAFGLFSTENNKLNFKAFGRPLKMQSDAGFIEIDHITGDIILSGGNVGIGTTTPFDKLTITESADNVRARLESFSTNVLHRGVFQFFKSASNTIGTDLETVDGDRAGSLVFVGVNSNDIQATGAEIRVTQNGAAGSSVVGMDMDFQLATSSASRSSVLFLESGGNVGIGTNNPTVELAIFKGTTTRLHLQNTASGVSATDGFQLALSGADAFVANLQNGDLKFYTNSDEHLRIHSTGGVSIGDAYVATDPGANNLIIEGNVGIGTDSPGNTLHVNSSAATSTKFTGAVQSFVEMEIAGGNSIFLGAASFGSGAFRILDNAGSFSMLTVTQTGAMTVPDSLNVDSGLLSVGEISGKVGIGTASPADKLQVVGGNILLDNARYLKWKNVAGGEAFIMRVSIDDNLYLNPATPGKSINFTDSGGNPMMTLTDAGTIGNAVITGNLVVEGSLLTIGVDTDDVGTNINFLGSSGEGNIDFDPTGDGAGNPLLTLDSATLSISDELNIGGVSGDGTGKVVCIKSDGDLGTCSSVVASDGTCTCG